jgi:GNAT superfamily N-acetyltransferase
METPALTVRPAVATDAEAIARLGSAFVEYQRTINHPAPQSITADAYLRDGFGDRPAFHGLVAEAGGEIVGYLLYHEGYDIDHGGRVFYIPELFVAKSARGSGAGFALMHEARDRCRNNGGHALLWTVYRSNVIARRFYERIGAAAVDETLMSWEVTKR